MPTPRLSTEAMQAAVDAWVAHGRSRQKAAAELGLNYSTYESRLERALAAGIGPEREFEAPELPRDVRPIEEILADRRRRWEIKSDHHGARKLVPIKVRTPGPIGIAVFGDPHIDNPGSNFPLLERHTRLIGETDGMFAGTVGDLQDAWVGRLAKLWAHQGISSEESLELVRWWIEQLSGKLLWITGGNHDAWAVGVNRADPMAWIAAQHGVTHGQDALRFALDLPDGSRFVVNTRHDFKGRSMWNPAHGPGKAVKMGWWDDLALCGHTHAYGYMQIKNPMTGKVSHAVRIASYKHIDGYAIREGFPDECVSECIVAIIDPDEPDERHKILIDPNPRRAAKILTAMRDEWKRRKAA